MLVLGKLMHLILSKSKLLKSLLMIRINQVSHQRRYQRSLIKRIRLPGSTDSGAVSAKKGVSTLAMHVDTPFCMSNSLNIIA